MICYFFANRSHVEQRIKKNHIYGDSNEGVKNDFRYDVMVAPLVHVTSHI